MERAANSFPPASIPTSQKNSLFASSPDSQEQPVGITCLVRTLASLTWPLSPIPSRRELFHVEHAVRLENPTHSAPASNWNLPVHAPQTAPKLPASSPP